MILGQLHRGGAEETGTTIWRTLVPLSTVQHLDLVKSTCFHHGPNTTFKCSIVSNPEEVAAGKGLWEMTLRYREDPTKVTEKKFSWGIPATNERVASHFTVSRDLMTRCTTDRRPSRRRYVRRSTWSPRESGASSPPFPAHASRTSRPMTTHC